MMMRVGFLSLVAALLVLCGTLSYALHPLIQRLHRWPSPRVPAGIRHPGTANCTESFFRQKLDHFGFGSLPSWAPTHYEQRYFTCLEGNWTPNSPIFFYTGNEVDVTLFVNMTGLMWENAPSFGAMLIFAEHRYFGKSLPFPSAGAMPAPQYLEWLTTDQALADFATLIEWFKLDRASPQSAVIGFGGSYGGMLCAWLRIKYPSALNGCIAGSAPIANFLYMSPPYDPESFAEAVTFDATTRGGSNTLCADNVRSVFQQLFTESNLSYSQVEAAAGLCAGSVKSLDDLYNVGNWVNAAFGMMAMSSYPFPSAYLMLGGGGVLPAYPERVACNYLSQTFANLYDQLAALRPAMGVYYNISGDQRCFDINAAPNEATEVTNYLWGYLACTSMIMPFSQNGVQDMFWSAPWNLTEAVEACQMQYNATPQADWVAINYGGKGVSEWGSNIVFSNGQLDPWRPGGIQNSSTTTVIPIIIPDVGHHIDLMFSHPEDTPAIRAAREQEIAFMAYIIAENSLKGRS